jgi:hypothetical protein
VPRDSTTEELNAGLSPAMLDLSDYPLLPIFLISSIIILAAGEIGCRLGVRLGNKGGDNVSTLEGAILGILALMIGFTFAMALSRFDGRRDLPSL